MKLLSKAEAKARVEIERLQKQQELDALQGQINDVTSSRDGILDDIQKVRQDAIANLNDFLEETNANRREVETELNALYAERDRLRSIAEPILEDATSQLERARAKVLELDLFEEQVKERESLAASRVKEAETSKQVYEKLEQEVANTREILSRKNEEFVSAQKAWSEESQALRNVLNQRDMELTSRESLCVERERVISARTEDLDTREEEVKLKEKQVYNERQMLTESIARAKKNKLL